jgi:hypothetical protein
MENRCQIEGCKKKYEARGYCKSHYYAARYRGDIPGSAKCIEGDCERGAFGRGYCQRHYAQHKRDGDFGRKCLHGGCVKGGTNRGYCHSHWRTRQRSGEIETLRRCDFSGCGKPHYAHGYCSGHATQLRKGEELRVIREKFQWYVTPAGYVRRSKPGGGSEYQHRVVMEESLGRELFPDENIHHKNGNRSDNRIENLELWPTKQPAGQRVEDKLEWADEMIARYRG